jgi:phage portal protein BeeE
MKLFGFNIQISRPDARPKLASSVEGAVSWQARSFSSTAAAWLSGQDLDAGGAVLSNAYQQVVWVYRAVNVLAEQVANIPFRFSIDRPGDERLIEDGPLHAFYSRPHPQIDRFQYWELRVIWLMLRGECFRLPIFEDGADFASPNSHRPGQPLRSVLILDPAHFQHIIQDHQLVGWLYTGLGPDTPLENRLLLPEEVWFEKLPDPFNFWRGLAPLQAAALACKTDFAAGAFMKGLMENNGDVGVIVRTQQALGPEQREQILGALRERKRKAGTADRPMLLAEGAEIVQPTLSSTDLQFLENRKFSRGEICAAFGVPEEIVTTTDTAKYNVMAGARLNFIENRVLPLCRRLEAAEALTVKALDPRAVGWFDTDSLPLLQQARRDRLKTAKAGFDMAIPLNELNRVFDLGFKPLPWGNRGYLPSGLTQAGELPPPAAPPTKTTPSAEPASPTTPSALSRLERLLDRPRPHAAPDAPASSVTASGTSESKPTAAGPQSSMTGQPSFSEPKNP